MQPKPVIGLVRHRVTERQGTSVGESFSDLETALSRSFQVERLPAYYNALTPEKKKELGAAFPNRCDLILPGNALNLYPLRNEIEARVPILSLPSGDYLGDAPRLERYSPIFVPPIPVSYTHLTLPTNREV